MLRRIRNEDGTNVYYDPMNGRPIIGSGWFDSISKMASKVASKVTSETAKKLAAKAGEKLVEEGSKKIGQKIGEKAAQKIDDLTTKKKPPSTTSNLGGEQIAKLLKVRGEQGNMSRQFEIDFL